jgi:putative serine protease PepD
VAGGYAVHAIDPRPAASTASSTSVAAATTTKSLAAVIAAVKDQVVSITVKGSSGEVEGSGVIVRSDGVIVTNNHVVSGAGTGATITVTLASGKTVAATVLATDPSADLALVKASGVSGLSAATLGDSDSVLVGDAVVAIGNEYGLAGSASAGIVSALHRTITVGGTESSPYGQQSVSDSAGTTYSDAIQTDAAINEGDSGGALFDMSGRVIGISAAIATTGSSSGSVGIGFAIPIDTVKQFIDKSL